MSKNNNRILKNTELQLTRLKYKQEKLQECKLLIYEFTALEEQSYCPRIWEDLNKSGYTDIINIVKKIDNKPSGPTVNQLESLILNLKACIEIFKAHSLPYANFNNNLDNTASVTSFADIVNKDQSKDLSGNYNDITTSGNTSNDFWEVD